MITEFKLFESHGSWYVNCLNKHLYHDELSNFKFKVDDYVKFHSRRYGIDYGTPFRINSINLSPSSNSPYLLISPFIEGITLANERDLELATEEEIENYRLEYDAKKYNL